MKTYIFINPFTFKPYEFSNCSFTAQSLLSENKKQLDGSYKTVHLAPIVLEVEKFDLSLLSKRYNPETGVLE